MKNKKGDFKVEKLKQDIKKREDILYKSMDDDEYVNPDMLDNALSVITAQRKYIDELEKRILI